ncbi:MAG: metallophosphoesterase family protein [Chloroflexi bacterium]|nr:metallophosphoesterase family protein [Chloroflexota bacterium]MBU1751869.1 metallophosphoesterase family protein [Chloroflexota bacterium]
MRILAVSDRVDARLYNPAVARNMADVDLLLGCGDLPPHYLDYLVSVLNVPLFYVAGNHDRPLSNPPPGESPMPFGGTDLDETVVYRQGLLIAGLEGSMRYNDGAGPQYTEREMTRKVARLVPSLLWNRLRYGHYLDILITHAPPRGIHDQNDLCHTGFNALLRLMDRFQPRYLLHGHVHVYAHGQQTDSHYGLTRVINVYPYRVLDVQARIRT